MLTRHLTPCIFLLVFILTASVSLSAQSTYRVPPQLPRAGYDNVATHGKGYSVISALATVIGEDTFKEILDRLLREFGGNRLGWRPFQRICEEEVGQSLDWFFQQWVRSAKYLDYRIISTNQSRNERKYITEVTVEKTGTIAMPVPVEAGWKKGWKSPSSGKEKKIDSSTVVNSPHDCHDCIFPVIPYLSVQIFDMRRFFLQGGKQDQSDGELLARYQRSDDQEVLAQLYGRYAELVYGVCIKYLKEPAAAEDATMAIYEELVNKTREHEIDKFRPWLYVLAKNHCLMQLRRGKRNVTVNYEPGIMHSLDSRHPTMEVEKENEEEARLKDCLEQLNLQQKQCIQMFYYQDHSYKEIAEIRKERLGKVRSYIQNGRRNLRICLEEKEKKFKN